MTNDRTDFYVYVLINPITDLPFYVGKGCRNRVRHHFRKPSKTLYYTNRRKYDEIAEIVAHGFLPLIEYIETDLSESEAFRVEMIMIKRFGRRNISTGILTNLTDGGEGSSGKIISPETKSKLRQSMLGSSNNMRGKTHSEECKNAISQKLRGRKRDDDFKKKISLANMGSKNPNYGKTMPEHTRKKLAEANRGSNNHNYGKNLPSEVRDKISQKLSYTYYVTAPDGTTYTVPNLKKFCSDHGLTLSCMRDVAAGRCNQHKGGWTCKILYTSLAE